MFVSPQPGRSHRDHRSRTPEELLEELGFQLPEDQIRLLSRESVDDRAALLVFILEALPGLEQTSWRDVQDLADAYKSTICSLWADALIVLWSPPFHSTLMATMRVPSRRSLFFDEFFHGSELRLIPTNSRGHLIDYAIQHNSESLVGLRPTAVKSLARAANAARLIALTRLACARLDNANVKQMGAQVKNWEGVVWSLVHLPIGMAALHEVRDFADSTASTLHTKEFLWGLGLSDPNYDPFDP